MSRCPDSGLPCPAMSSSVKGLGAEYSVSYRRCADDAGKHTSANSGPSPNRAPAVGFESYTRKRPAAMATPFAIISPIRLKRSIR